MCSDCIKALETAQIKFGGKYDVYARCKKCKEIFSPEMIRLLSINNNYAEIPIILSKYKNNESFKKSLMPLYKKNKIDIRWNDELVLVTGIK